MPYTYHINCGMYITYYFLLEYTQNYNCLITYITRILEENCLVSRGKDRVLNK